MTDVIRTGVTKHGQLYLDEPILAKPIWESHLSRCVRQSFGDDSEPAPILLGHERIKLRWVKPKGVR